MGCRARLVVLLGLCACGGAGASGNAHHLPEDGRVQRCELVGDVTLVLPLLRGHAIATTPEACMIIDETRQATLVSIAALDADTAGAELSVRDPERFFVDTGLLGANASLNAATEIDFLGRERSGRRWRGTPAELPPREGFAFATRQGPIYLVVFVMHDPGDADAEGHLRALTGAVRLER